MGLYFSPPLLTQAGCVYILPVSVYITTPPPEPEIRTRGPAASSQPGLPHPTGRINPRATIIVEGSCAEIQCLAPGGEGSGSVRRWPGPAALYRMRYLWQKQGGLCSVPNDIPSKLLLNPPDIRGFGESHGLGTASKCTFQGCPELASYFWGLVVPPGKSECGVRGVLRLQWELTSPSTMRRERPFTSKEKLASQVSLPL